MEHLDLLAQAQVVHSIDQSGLDKGKYLERLRAMWVRKTDIRIDEVLNGEKSHLISDVWLHGL